MIGTTCGDEAPQKELERVIRSCVTPFAEHDSHGVFYSLIQAPSTRSDQRKVSGKVKGDAAHFQNELRPLSAPQKSCVSFSAPVACSRFPQRYFAASR